VVFNLLGFKGLARRGREGLLIVSILSAKSGSLKSQASSTAAVSFPIARTVQN